MTEPQSPHVLVVDDAAPVRELFARHLTLSGLDVVLAHDGRAGLAQARVRTPDVVVSDFRMPPMDGLALCRALRRDPATRDVPIVLVSGEAPVSALAVPHAGWSAMLQKPCAPAVLVATIRQLLADGRP